MLGREESGYSRRTDFPYSTINDYLREEEQNTCKVLTVYDPRKDTCESARSRSALKRYPLRCLVVVVPQGLGAPPRPREEGQAGVRAPVPVGRRQAADDHGRHDDERHGGRGLRFLGAPLTRDARLSPTRALLTLLTRCGITQEGGVTEAKYLTWFKAKVMPMLNRWGPENPAPNSIVCLDNVNLQHSPRLLDLLRRAGVKVFHFARYDPTLSPIEKAFNQMKAFLRRPGVRQLLHKRPWTVLRAALPASARATRKTTCAGPACSCLRCRRRRSGGSASRRGGGGCACWRGWPPW